LITQDGKPCDDGLCLLARDKVPPMTLGTARIIKQECRYFIVLAKTRVSILLEEKTLKEALRSLYITLKLNLQIISISKTDVDNVSWATVEKFL